MSANLTQTSPTSIDKQDADQAQSLSLPDDLRNWLVEQGRSRSADQRWSSAGERFRNIQTTALAALANMPFPTRKTESWRYTSVQPLIAAVNGNTINERDNPQPGSVERQPEALQSLIAEADLLVRFSDTGSVSLQLGLGDAARLLSVTLHQCCGETAAPATNQAELLDEFGRGVPEGYFPFVCVNAALLTSCLEVRVAMTTDSKVVKPRIVLLRSSVDGTRRQVETERSSRLLTQHSRLLLKLDRDAQAELTEVRLDADAGPVFATSVVEASLDSNSVLEHYQFAAAGSADSIYSAGFVTLGNHARYAFNGQNTGSALSRTDINVALAAPGAYAAVNAHLLLNGSRRCDYHTSLEHMAPHCESDEQVRSIVSDKGKAVFNGRIHIHRDAQKTRAEMNNRNLLMSPQAEVNTKPELEIYADDVKCTHGATIGQLDANAVFYCKSRGIDEQSARALLSEAFIVETIQLMPAATQQDLAMALLQYFQEAV